MISSISQERCDGCGVCAELCPSDVLRVDPTAAVAVVAYQEDCMTCYNCERFCPKGAIRVRPFKREQPLAWKPFLPTGGEPGRAARCQGGSGDGK